MVVLYEKKCEKFLKSGICLGFISGIGLGFFNFVIFVFYVFVFWFGVKLVDQGKIKFVNVFKVFFVIVMSVIGVLQFVGLIFDLIKIKFVVNLVFELFDRKLCIDFYDQIGMMLKIVKGDIEFCNISFIYFFRLIIFIFKDLSFIVLVGKVYYF